MSISSPPGSGPITGALAPGVVLAGRYELLEQVSGATPSALWRATDRTLARTVAVRTVPADGSEDQARAERFLAAAGLAGRVSSPLASRTDDAALVNVDGHRVAFVVESWVGGTSLADELAGGPLEADRALAITRQVAAALVAAERAGVSHGHLRPEDVMLGPEGSVTVTGFAVQAALHSATPMDPARDTRAAAGCLYACLTGHWPGPGQSALPEAPVSDGRVCSPRQVRGGVPRSLESLVLRGIDPLRVPRLEPLERPGQLLAAVEEIQHAGPLPAPAPRHGRRRTAGRWARAAVFVALPVVALVALGEAGYRTGEHLVQVNNPHGALLGLPTAAPAGPAAAPSASPAAPYPIAAVRDFDPEGDGQERPDAVRLAVDGDPSDGWVTEIYQNGPRFASKPGVGLMVDLGSPQRVGEVDLVLPAGGENVQVRAANVDGPTEAALPVVVTADNAAGVVTLHPSGAPTARYWLIWLTSLPKTPGGYQGGINEITLRH